MNWPAESIWLSLSAMLPGITVEVLPEVDSSNSELMRRARAGQAEPVLLVAEHQTAGRGRLGRAWQGQAGQTLMFSLGLPLAPQDWSGLSLAVGLSLAHSLDPQRQHGVHLKWPNDLWLALDNGPPTRWGKLAGVLIETAVTGPASGAPTARYTVIGVGLNLGRPEATDLAIEPAAWASVVPQASAPEVLAQIAAPLLRDVLAFAQSGFAPLQNAFNARDALANTPVRLTDGREGVACGVDAQGALRVQTDQGVQTIHASEVSVRPSAT